MLALVNFNSYLGGGETLLVRWGEYLQIKGEDFLLYYKKNSYIEKDLERISIDKSHLRPIENNVDYYYLSKSKRKMLISEMTKDLDDCNEVTFVSFCARELYTLVDLTRDNVKFKLAHLVLHNQDNLYTCQTLWDKLLLKIKGERRFSKRSSISFNINLFNEICEKSVVIPQSVLQSRLWNKKFNILLDANKTVALPVCDFSKVEHHVPFNNKKILWIGRIVDFKIPSLCAMIDFVGANSSYRLTIVGDGEINIVKEYIKKKEYKECLFDFLGKVDYSDLPDVIKNHSVGYAMGTSIVEIGKHGIPVIMALGAPDFEMFNSPKCGGLYIGISRGNVGDTLYFVGAEDPIVPIKEAIAQLESDYEALSIKCYNCIKENFDSEINFNLYQKYIYQAKHVDSVYAIPQASIMRKLAFKYFG